MFASNSGLEEFVVVVVFFLQRRILSMNFDYYLLMINAQILIIPVLISSSISLTCLMRYIITTYCFHVIVN